jgi:hypothetical protein
MSAPKLKPETPAVAVDITTAAGLLGLSVDIFREHVEPQLSVIPITPRCRRVAVAELERWCAEHAETVR